MGLGLGCIIACTSWYSENMRRKTRSETWLGLGLGLGLGFG